MSNENLFWHVGHVDRAGRERLKGHQGACIWLTGLSGAGKSSVAIELDALLHARGIHTYMLDGDNVRQGLCGNLGFTAQARDENIRRVSEVAKLMADAGLVTIAAFISPYRGQREQARARFEAGRFLEVWVRCPVDVCRERDPKGLYKRADAGLIKDFTGVDAPYEEPQSPEIIVDTVADETPQQSAARVLALVESRGILSVVE